VSNVKSVFIFHKYHS